MSRFAPPSGCAHSHQQRNDSAGEQDIHFQGRKRVSRSYSPEINGRAGREAAEAAGKRTTQLASEKLQDARTALEQVFLQGCVSGVVAPDLLYLSTLGRKPSMKT